jgi:hypothetical protein
MGFRRSRMKLFAILFGVTLGAPAFAQEQVATEQALFDGKKVSVDDIVESGVAAFAEQALAYELTVFEPWDGWDPGEIQAATLYVCTQSGGVNVPPGALYCETEWVAATCEEVGYVSGMPTQSGPWIWGCNDDPPGTPL